MLLQYKTVRAEGIGEVVEKKSRFLSYVKPITTEQQALDFIAAIRSKHYDARHNVFAYVLRQDNLQRYSDDGEPSGTAGMPTLDTLRKEQLTDVCLVTARYFGGTLLGTGGLVRAYTHSAKEGLAAAGIVTRRFCHVYTLELDYTLLGKVQNEAQYLDCIPGEITYTDQVAMTYFVPATEVNFEQRLTEVTNGKITLKKQQKGLYIDVI